jgi:thioredoxin-like negative regulator of GroEL
MNKENIMGKILVFLSLMATLLTAGPAIAGDQAAPLSTTELKQVIGSGKKSTLVFFQNPMGGPCRVQKEILQKLQQDRKNNFNIANVSTMKAGDQRAFYDYGIRNLPMLVLVDKQGKVGRVFPPGIQSYEALAAALDGSR